MVRNHPMLPPVESIGWLPHKKSRVDFSFFSCNFSFIRSGKGSYHMHGAVYPVAAPCVLHQWPGAPMDYGPDTEWAELYICYPPDCQSVLEKANTFDTSHPVRDFFHTKAFLLAEERIFTEILESDKGFSPDLADRLCWDLISESFPRPEETAEPESLRLVRERLERPLNLPFRAEETARECGMSLSTLRRRWAEFHGGQTFTEYRSAYFLCESRRLLVESGLRMKEVAERLGFRDPYYFSRKFHALAGETPTHYRERHRIPQNNRGKQTEK